MNQSNYSLPTPNQFLNVKHDFQIKKSIDHPRTKKVLQKAQVIKRSWIETKEKYANTSCNEKERSESSLMINHA